MIPQPAGWLRRASEIARGYGALLIADEVLTAFGRAASVECQPSLLASHQESVQPDLAAIAKGLTGGYLPMAATLSSQPIFDAFLGEYEEFKTFFHGHSYTANQLGGAAALASLKLLESRASLGARRKLQKTLRDALTELWSLANVGDIRQVGSIVGIELVRDWRTREPFALAEQAGIRVCQAMARRGVLTRPIGNVIVLMPPFCATTEQVRRMLAVLTEAITNTFHSESGASGGC